ncbi:TPA: hypothetical protein ACF35N_004540 [Vibrio parahaemolyticus]|uniref:hypothetical protein n=1 Tax=Vibrio parahaemolyticus TaxID=670 RepID=UPI00111E800A|nr:hypothetical protein [Vibrio parahaemolyticus]TNZ83869.1 hypothetical protein CGK38_23420 [Vibrio parahaemolyticus]
MLEVKEMSYTEQEKELIRRKYIDLCNVIMRNDLALMSYDIQIIIKVPEGEYRDPPGICVPTPK